MTEDELLEALTNYQNDVTENLMSRFKLELAVEWDALGEDLQKMIESLVGTGVTHGMQSLLEANLVNEVRMYQFLDLYR